MCHSYVIKNWQINLYGVVAIAVLAGLYTDMATQKLKEVFAVVFLNRGNKVTHLEIISEGGITGVVADPRIEQSIRLGQRLDRLARVSLLQQRQRRDDARVGLRLGLDLRGKT